jgi:hypothetical protein
MAQDRLEENATSLDVMYTTISYYREVKRPPKTTL